MNRSEPIRTDQKGQNHVESDVGVNVGGHVKKKWCPTLALAGLGT